MYNSDSKMFQPNTTYKPFSYPTAVMMCVEHERMHWHEGEIDLLDDVNDWKLGHVNAQEKNFITQILRMFTQSDVAVGGFYLDNLIPIFQNNEIRNMMSSFATREGVHQRAYALLNDTLGIPESEYAAFLEIQEMSEKDSFMRAADPSTLEGLAQTLAKGTFNEGVSLFASFVMLLNFQRRGLMKGMGKVVEWSVKDESVHVQGVTWMFRELCEEHPHIVNDNLKKAIYDMARECVDLEDRFIDLSFEMGGVEGITADEVKQYIRYIADRRLVQLGLKENWGIDENPLPWVDILISAKDHTNFFEGKVTEYEVGALTGEWDYDDFNPELLVYGRQGCPYCDNLKILLTQRNVPFQYVDLTDNARRTAFYEAYDFKDSQRTMPKVFHWASQKEYRKILADPMKDPMKYVGGYEETAVYLSGYINETKG